MRAWMVTGLLLAAAAFADDYPAPAGFVNDFANQLPVTTVQDLEKKVRDYERTTGNEIAVAVVPSLNGMLVDEYARGLFHAWGVGKRALNNGVLFVWAPKERRIRIEVGIGLQGVLTDVAAGRIVSRVRDLFRGGRYDAGVNAAVDGIIEVLGTGQAGGTSAQDERNFVERNSPEELERQRREEARRQQEEDAARAASERMRLIDYGLAAVLVVALYLIYRRMRAARWQEELPRGLAEADQALGEADRKKAQAQVALVDLRKEAPDEICRRFDAALGSAPDELGRQRSGLEELRLLPRVTYKDLKAAHRGLRSWQVRMAITANAFDEVPGALETFRAQREEAQRMLQSLPSKLARTEAERMPGPSEGLLPTAAAETYNQALQESQKQPANWLPIYDLLADVSECLEQIENPSMRMPYRPARYWSGDINSPAGAALAMFYASQAALSQVAASSDDDSFDSGSSGAGSGGFSGGGDSGGFGGGDSGGGGASSDY
jgi:uncharacterized membrane protein YgcG